MHKNHKNAFEASASKAVVNKADITTKNKGFTLIEVLVVIGIIAVLAAIVLVAVNPARQFKLARDSERLSNVNAILNAIHQNMAEHRGVFICNGAPLAIPGTYTFVASTTDTSRLPGNPSVTAKIASCVVPDYISSLPYDPSQYGAYYKDETDYNTGYEITQDANGRITASSTGELTGTISVTR